LAGRWLSRVTARGWLLWWDPGKYRRQGSPDLVHPRPQEPPVPPGCQRLILGVHSCDQLPEQAADLSGPVPSPIIGCALGQEVPAADEVDQGGP
jgi:hypothetical protein